MMGREERLSNLRRVLMSRQFSTFYQGEWYQWIDGFEMTDAQIVGMNRQLETMFSSVVDDNDHEPKQEKLICADLESEFERVERQVMELQKPMAHPYVEATHQFRIPGVGAVMADLTDDGKLPYITFEAPFARKLIEGGPYDAEGQSILEDIRDGDLDEVGSNSLPRKIEEIKELGYKRIGVANFIHEAAHLYLSWVRGSVDRSILWRATLGKEFSSHGSEESRRNLEDACEEERIVLGFQALVNNTEGDDDETAKDSGFNLHVAAAAMRYAVEVLEADVKLTHTAKEIAGDFGNDFFWQARNTEDGWDARSLTDVMKMDEAEV